jgi:lipopolysaccharide heptosyltransferase II
MATPLLAALSEAFPDARFDWAVGDWARPVVVGNPRITQLISTGSDDLGSSGWKEIRAVVKRIRAEGYDTCYIPGRSSLLSLIPWLAAIPQRVGLNMNGRGFAHTLSVKPQPALRHQTSIYLSLASAVGLPVEKGYSTPMEFYPPDEARTDVTRRLVDEVDWLGDKPLVIMHPGGGANPTRADVLKQWPVERFVLLGNHLVRVHGAQLLLIGGESDANLASEIAGMLTAPSANWAGSTGLGEVGALAEVADLYIGNDAGPTHIAAAAGCPTLAIYGPSDPAVSGPYGASNRVISLWREHEAGGKAFAWEGGVSVKEATAAADLLLARRSGSAIN